MNWRNTTVALLVVAMIAVAFCFGRAWSLRRQWSDLDQRQRATILRLKQFPPEGEDAHSWSEAITTLCNVWGNVTFAPSYSGISNAEMQTLQTELDQLVNKTTAENSALTVDRIYGMLLSRAKRPQFVAAYRAEFLEGFGESRPNADEH